MLEHTIYIYLRSAKNYEIRMEFDKDIAKLRRTTFLKQYIAMNMNKVVIKFYKVEQLHKPSSPHSSVG